MKKKTFKLTNDPGCSNKSSNWNSYYPSIKNGFSHLSRAVMTLQSSGRYSTVAKSNCAATINVASFTYAEINYIMFSMTMNQNFTLARTSHFNTGPSSLHTPPQAARLTMSSGIHEYLHQKYLNSAVPAKFVFGITL